MSRRCERLLASRRWQDLRVQITRAELDREISELHALCWHARLAVGERSAQVTDYLEMAMVVAGDPCERAVVEEVAASHELACGSPFAAAERCIPVLEHGWHAKGLWRQLAFALIQLGQLGVVDAMADRLRRLGSRSRHRFATHCDLRSCDVRTTEGHPTCEQYLDELLADPEFLKILALAAKEVMSRWDASYGVARGFVLSAIGEPRTVEQIHAAWMAARVSGDRPALAKLMVRRRVIDLLRKDARPGEQTESIEDDAHEPASEALDGDPRAQLEVKELIAMARAALACFASQGVIQRRQAELLAQRLEHASYEQLGRELGCNVTALRVRAHNAMVAFRRHILECHPELEDLFTRRALLALAPPDS